MCATDPRNFEVEAFCHFQHRQFGNISVRLLAKNFGQEKNVIENLDRHALFTRAHHPSPLSAQKKALHRITDERPCSTNVSLSSSMGMSNRYASITYRKIAVISSMFCKTARSTAYMRVRVCLERWHRTERIRNVLTSCPRNSKKISIPLPSSSKGGI
jgi:hypothetical protein